MKSRLITGAVLLWVLASQRGHSQEVEIPAKGADLLVAAKFYACQMDKGDREIQRNIAKYFTEARHTFVASPQVFVIGEEKFPGVLFVEKPAGSLLVFSSQKVHGRVSIKSQVQLPLQQDLDFIDSIYPELKAHNGGTPQPEKDTRIRAYTTWYTLRFEDASGAGGTPAFAPLTKDSFFSAFTKLCYVEIDSNPSGAKLSVVGYDGWNETRDTGFLPEGDVTIVVSKDGYKATMAKEKVKLKGKNSFVYSLTPVP